MQTLEHNCSRNNTQFDSNRSKIKQPRRRRRRKKKEGDIEQRKEFVHRVDLSTRIGFSQDIHLLFYDILREEKRGQRRQWIRWPIAGSIHFTDSDFLCSAFPFGIELGYSPGLGQCRSCIPTNGNSISLPNSWSHMTKDVYTSIQWEGCCHSSIDWGWKSSFDRR